MLPVVIGILWFSKLSIQYKCIHDEMQHFERPIYLDNESIFSKSVRDYAEIESTPVPLEIHFEFVSSFAYIKHSDIIKKQVLEEAKKEIKELLKVKRPQRPLLFPRDCKNNLVSMVKGITVCARGCLPQTRCKKYNLPDYMLRGCLSINNLTPKAGPGVPNVDIVLFVQAESCTGATLAWATFCKMDLDTNRPTAGIVNLCVNSFNGKNIRGSVNTIKHEIIHALGFSESAFPYFRDPSGKPYTKRNKFGFPDIVGNKRFSERVAKQFKVSRQSARLKYTKMMWGFQLPTILKSARQYFNCPSLQYMPLEDSGGGNRGFTSHFDELVTGVELMSPITHYGTGRLSVLTVAILEDTGWYVGDYLKVDKFYYGKNYGCHFVTNGCYEFIVSQMRKLLDIFPFCNTMYNGYSMRCSEDYEYVQVCSLHKYPTLDKRYQYLNAINGLLAEDGLPNQYAGSSVEAEHCPLYGLISYADKSNRICKDGHNTNKDASDQKKLVNYFGKDSICIPTSKTRYNVLKYSSWDGAYGAACLQYACDMKLKQLTVYSQKKLIATCSDIGKEHKFNDGLVKGAIICPSFKMTCTANTLKPIYENFANSIQVEYESKFTPKQGQSTQKNKSLIEFPKKENQASKAPRMVPRIKLKERDFLNKTSSSSNMNLFKKINISKRLETENKQITIKNLSSKSKLNMTNSANILNKSKVEAGNKSEIKIWEYKELLKLKAERIVLKVAKIFTSSIPEASENTENQTIFTESHTTLKLSTLDYQSSKSAHYSSLPNSTLRETSTNGPMTLQSTISSTVTNISVEESSKPSESPLKTDSPSTNFKGTINISTNRSSENLEISRRSDTVSTRDFLSSLTTPKNAELTTDTAMILTSDKISSLKESSHSTDIVNTLSSKSNVPSNSQSDITESSTKSKETTLDFPSSKSAHYSSLPNSTLRETSTNGPSKISSTATNMSVEESSKPSESPLKTDSPSTNVKSATNNYTNQSTGHVEISRRSDTVSTRDFLTSITTPKNDRITIVTTIIPPSYKTSRFKQSSYNHNSVTKLSTQSNTPQNNVTYIIKRSIRSKSTIKNYPFSEASKSISTSYVTALYKTSFRSNIVGTVTNISIREASKISHAARKLVLTATHILPSPRMQITNMSDRLTVVSASRSKPTVTKRRDIMDNNTERFSSIRTSNSRFNESNLTNLTNLYYASRNTFNFTHIPTKFVNIETYIDV